MTTPELLSYIRGEVAKGKTREEIKGTLVLSGGWSDDDLSEAFRQVIPMQGMVLPKENVTTTPALSINPSITPAPMRITPSVQTFSPPSLSSLAKPSPSFSTSPSSSSLRSPGAPSPYSPSPSMLKSSVPYNTSPNTKTKVPTHSWVKFLIVLVVIVALGIGFWYFSQQILNLPKELSNLWTSHMTSNPVVPSSTDQTSNTTTPAANTVPQATDITECGTGVAPKFGTPATYENNSVLACLGDSAISCGNAEGTVADALFPTFFEIVKTQDSCNFKLSYPADSTLTDITGKPLAGQYISCPIDIVKTIDNSKPATPKFTVPTKTDSSKYASDIYFYGTLGLFVENNIDANKIQTLGCSGPYIQSVIASYNAKK